MSARAVELFVECLGRVVLRWECGDNEPWIRAFAQVLGFTDNAPRPRPALAGRVDEVTKHPRWLSRAFMELSGLLKLAGYGLNETRVLR